MLSAARVNIIRILSCIKVASISLFNRLFLHTILSLLSLLPHAVPFICLSSTNLAHLFLDLCPFLQPSLLFVTPLPPVRSSRLPAPSFQPCQFLPPYLPLSVTAVTPSLPLSLLSSPISISSLSSSPLIRIHPNIHFHSSLTISVLKFTFASSILCPFMNFSFFFVLSLLVCSLILLAHHSVPACLSGSIHSCTSAGSRQHERWLKNSFEAMKWHYKGSFTHDILRCSS